MLVQFPKYLCSGILWGSRPLIYDQNLRAAAGGEAIAIRLFTVLFSKLDKL